jgi:hypothetical protein
MVSQIVVMIFLVLLAIGGAVIAYLLNKKKI